MVLLKAGGTISLGVGVFASTTANTADGTTIDTSPAVMTTGDYFQIALNEANHSAKFLTIDNVDAGDTVEATMCFVVEPA